MAGGESLLNSRTFLPSHSVRKIPTMRTVTILRKSRIFFPSFHSCHFFAKLITYLWMALYIAVDSAVDPSRFYPPTAMEILYECHYHTATPAE